MKVICLGSGKNMPLINDWNTDGITICGVNNIWKGTDKWDVLLHSGDYPFKSEITKTRPNQTIVSRDGKMGYTKSYVAMSSCETEPKKLPWKEARIHLGLPIYFTLSYWVLHYLKPTHIGFLGFDMNYVPDEKGSTTFYGVGYDMQNRGIPDPLYQFRNIEAYKKHDNMMEILLERLIMRKGSCELYNLSDDPSSVLPWQKITIEQFRGLNG